MQKIVIVAMLIGIISISLTVGISYGEQERKIPSWVKGIFAYYVDGEIKDTEVLDALGFLASEGILKIQEKQYEPFSKEKFPKTGGFNPAWLDGEHDKILKNCQDAKKMGFENSYCKYLQ